MKRISVSLLATILLGLPVASIQADEPDAQAVLDKAIKALGGEEKLGKIGVATWKTRSKFTFNENESEFRGEATVQGLDHYRTEFQGEFNGNTFKGIVVLNGDKGWRKFGENLMEMDADGVSNEKRNVYLQVIPITLVPLKGKTFKVNVAGEDKVDDKPAVILEVTAPDGRNFKLFIDKESNLPVKLAARVVGFGGQEFNQETTLGGYKDFDGIKKATKVVSKRDGQKFAESEITEFKVLDKAEAATFAEPQ
jgi:hypothetical protein